MDIHLAQLYWNDGEQSDEDENSDVEYHEPDGLLEVANTRVTKILEAIVPHVGRWALLDVSADHRIWLPILHELVSCTAGAPVLETLRIDIDEFTQRSVEELCAVWRYCSATSLGLFDAREY